MRFSSLFIAKTSSSVYFTIFFSNLKPSRDIFRIYFGVFLFFLITFWCPLIVQINRNTDRTDLFFYIFKDLRQKKRSNLFRFYFLVVSFPADFSCYLFVSHYVDAMFKSRCHESVTICYNNVSNSNCWILLYFFVAGLKGRKKMEMEVRKSGIFLRKLSFENFMHFMWKLLLDASILCLIWRKNTD